MKLDRKCTIVEEAPLDSSYVCRDNSEEEAKWKKPVIYTSIGIVGPLRSPPLAYLLPFFAVDQHSFPTLPPYPLLFGACLLSFYPDVDQSSYPTFPVSCLLLGACFGSPVHTCLQAGLAVIGVIAIVVLKVVGGGSSAAVSAVQRNARVLGDAVVFWFELHVTLFVAVQLGGGAKGGEVAMSP